MTKNLASQTVYKYDV